MATDLSPLTPAELNPTTGAGGNAAVGGSATDLSPLTPAEQKGGSIDLTLSPGWSSTLDDSTRYADLGSRIGIHSLLAVPDLLATSVQGGGIDRSNADQVFAETGGNYSGDAVKAAVPPDKPAWVPSQAVINGLGIGPRSDDPAWVKTADNIGPWLVPGANTFARIKETPALVGKLAAGAGSTLMGGADWLASNEAQDLAQKYGYGPVAQTIASIVAPLVRGAAFRTTGAVAHKAFGTGDEGGAAYDVNRAVGATPPAGSVAGPFVQKVENFLGSIPVVRGPIVAAREAQKEAIANPAFSGRIGVNEPTPVENATAAQKTVVEPQGQSMPWWSVAVPSAFGSLIGLHGAAVGALPHTLGRIAAGALEDPSVVRALAGRGVTTPLVQQYAQRAALGATSPPSPPSPLTNAILGYAQPAAKSIFGYGQ
jgi:hypothetical protein